MYCIIPSEFFVVHAQSPARKTRLLFCDLCNKVVYGGPVPDPISKSLDVLTSRHFFKIPVGLADLQGFIY